LQSMHVERRYVFKIVINYKRTDLIFRPSMHCKKG
jgi:hypothetical protein